MNIPSISSSASLIIKKVEPQMSGAHTSMGLASFFNIVSFIKDSAPGFQIGENAV